MKSLLILLSVLFVFGTTACNKAADKKDDKKDEKKDEKAEKKDEKSEAGGEKWDASLQEKYMGGCMESAEKDFGKDKAKGYCQCTLDKIMAKYKAEELESKLKETEMMDLAMGCVKELDIKVGK